MGILALDIATCSGVCFINEQFIEYIGIIDLSKIDDNLYDRCDCFIAKIHNIINNDVVDKIIIENPLLKFAGGKSSIFTISKLLQLNAVISDRLYQKYNIKPIHISAQKARNLCGIKKQENINFKELVLQMAKNEIHPGIQKKIWRYITKGKNIGKDHSVNYDMADAFLLAKSSFLL